MEKEFVTYEQALALKELGFDEPCFVYYCEDIGYQIQYKNPIISENFNSRKGVYLNDVSAPLKQQAFRWFREKYGDFLRYDWGEVPHFLMIQIEITKGKTYEEAESACLDKLIEIIKTR